MSSDSESSKSENNDNMEQKEKSSTAYKLSSSSDIKSNDSSDSSHIADRIQVKLLKPTVDGLAKGLSSMRITKSAALSMQEIAKWCLVGGEDIN